MIISMEFSAYIKISTLYESNLHYAEYLGQHLKKPTKVSNMVVHAFNYRTWAAESGRSLYVQGQLGLHSKAFRFKNIQQILFYMVSLN